MRSAKAAFGAIVVGAWVIGGVASATSTTSAPKSYVITIENMQFNPPQITVHRGDRVVWVNKDFFAHTATADAKAFDSLAIAPNASWTYVAHRVGDYSYKCTFHPTMRGMLTVAP
jgi:plastocyanin